MWKKLNGIFGYFTIRKQLVTVAVVVNMLVGIIAVVFMQNYMGYSDANLSYISQINDINSLYDYQQRNLNILMNAMKENNPNVSEEFGYNMGVINSLIDIIGTNSEYDAVKVKLRTLPYLERNFESNSLKVINFSSDDMTVNERYEIYEKAVDYQSQISGCIQKILAVSMDENKESLSETESMLRLTQRRFTVIIIGICILNVVFYIFYTTYITKPIYTLSSKVKSIGKGNWDIDMSDVGGPQDIKFLAQTIETMSYNIKQLNKDVEENAKLQLKLYAEELETVRMQELLKESKLQLIQMQINPHFLFNTLNVISRMALLENSYKAYDLIIALSKFMRHNLKQANNTIKLVDEVDMVKQYLYILKARMGDHLDTKVYMGEMMADEEVPILILQPIIENAFCHGIEDMVEGGIIGLSIKKCNNTIFIRIYDNGKGMDQETLSSVRSKTKVLKVDFDKDKHIGIENVCCRLNLIYGEKVRYIVSSIRSQGTIFTIQIDC